VKILHDGFRHGEFSGHRDQEERNEKSSKKRVKEELTRKGKGSAYAHPKIRAEHR